MQSSGTCFGTGSGNPVPVLSFLAELHGSSWWPQPPSPGPGCIFEHRLCSWPGSCHQLMVGALGPFLPEPSVHRLAPAPGNGFWTSSCNHTPAIRCPPPSHVPIYCPQLLPQAPGTCSLPQLPKTTGPCMLTAGHTRKICVNRLL